MLFDEYILKKLPSDFSFLDAGGGTGRWLIDVLETKKSFDSIMEIEKQLIATGGDEIAARGNNIFIAGIKS